MALAPRPRHEHLLNGPTLLRAYLFLGPIQAAAAMAAFFFTLLTGGWRFGQTPGHADPLYVRATTACLGAIVLMQVANAFICRSDGSSVLRLGFRGTRALNWGIMFEVTLIVLVVYTPFGNSLVGTAPLPWHLWLFILPFQAAMVLLEEARLWLTRRIRAVPSTHAAKAPAPS
jgi:magnesium-transporting ATPase (P-type)